MKTKLSFRLLALFLTLLILVSALPLSVFAIDNSTKGKSEVSAQADPVELSETKGVSIIPTGSEPIKPFIREVTELRDKYVKHFDNGDGTYEAITYGSAVHRKDANGEWQDIDNTLSLGGEKGKERFASADGRIFFTDTLEKDGVVWSISDNGYVISLSIAEADLRSNARADVKNHLSRSEALASAEKADDRDSVIRVDNRTTVLYRDVLPGVDLEYALFSNNVKESILVNAPGEKYEYAFKLALTGLIPKLIENGSILFCDEKDGEIVYSIPAPYMFDEKGAYSEDVWYTLENVEEGVYSLIVSASPEWINDSERVFPVVIDPTFTETSGTCDTFFSRIDETAKSTNYGGWSVMWLNNYETPFIKSTDMPVLPSGATVTNAQLFVSYYYYSGVTGSMTVSAHRANLSWSEYDDTWNTMSQNGLVTTLGLAVTPLDTEVLYTSSTYPQWVGFNITSAVQSWYNPGSLFSNNGIGLKRVSGNGSVILHARDAGNGYAAYFSVSYRPINGIYAVMNFDAGCFLKGTSPLLSGRTSYSPSERDSIFKFAYRAGTDDFVIRSMVDNSLIVYHNIPMHKPLAESVTANGVPVSDSNLTSTFTWKIGVHPDCSDGYRFAIWNVCGGQNYYLAAEETSYGYSITLTTNASAPGTEWCFLHEPDYDGKGVVPQTPVPQRMITGQTIDFDFTMYDYRAGINGPVTYNVSTLTGGTTNIATINTSTGVCTAVSPGTFRLRVSYPSAGRIWFYNIEVAPSYEGTFFIRNVEASNYGPFYMQADKYPSPNSDDVLKMYLFDGTSAQTSAQKWRIIHLGEQKYKIVLQSTGKALTAPVPTSTNGPMTQASYTGMDRQKWNIQKTEEGYYKLSPVSSPTKFVAISDGQQGVMGGRNVLLRSNLSNNMDEWELFNCSPDYSHLMIGNYTGDPDEHEIGIEVSSNYSDNGLNGNTYFNVRNSEAIYSLTHGESFVVQSHGEKTYVLLSGEETLSISDLNALSSNALGNNVFVLYAACLCGSESNNLVDATYAKGAQCVIGFTINIRWDESYVWTETFLLEMGQQGCSIEEAMSSADAAVQVAFPYRTSFTTSASNRYVLGNTQGVINP